MISSALDVLQTEYSVWNGAFVEGKSKILQYPIMLDRITYEKLSRTAVRFDALIEKTIEMIRQNPEHLKFFRFPKSIRRLIESDLGSGTGRHSQFSRHDLFVLEDGTIRISESNTDVPGGLHESAGLHDVVFEKAYLFTAHMLLAGKIAKVKPERVALLYSTGYGEDLEQCSFVSKMLKEHGIGSVLCGIANVEFRSGVPFVFGKPIDYVYRFFPSEWIPRAGFPCSVPMVNGFSQLIAQSKRFAAFLHEKTDLFTHEERVFIEEVVPFTVRFEKCDRSELVKDRKKCVVKKDFGRVGEEVLIGSLMTDGEWRDALSWPASEPTRWVVQEFFKVKPHNIYGRKFFPCFGCYTVDGEFGGMYTRAAEYPLTDCTANITIADYA